MGGLVIGNFFAASEPTQTRSFVYNIASKTFTELFYSPSGNEIYDRYGITAYCIWHYAGTNFYQIAGGVVDLVSQTQSGYIVDWDSTTQNASNWRLINHGNMSTHFEGMWPDLANEGSFPNCIHPF